MSGLPVFSNELEEDYFDIASNYCVLGDYSQAIEYLDKILDINPRNSKAINLKNKLVYFSKETQQNNHNFLNPKIKESLEYKKSGNLKSEYNALNSSLGDKDSFISLYYLGNFYREINDYTKAIEAFNKAIETNQNFLPAYLSCAILNYETGNYKAAKSLLDKYTVLNPNDDLGFAMKARTEFELGLINEAKTDNDKAISLNNNPEYQFDKAKILYKLGDYQKAKSIFSSLTKDINISKIYEYMGLCDMETQNYSSALLNIDKALLLSDNDKYLENKYYEIKNRLENK